MKRDDRCPSLTRRHFGWCGCATIGLSFSSFFFDPSVTQAGEWYDSLHFKPPPNDANYIQDRVDAMRAHSRSARKEFRANMTEEERDIASDVRYSVIATDVNNAVAYRDKAGVRRIDMYVGAIRTVEQIAASRSLSQIPETSGRVEGYLDYAGKEIQRRLSDPSGTVNDPPIKSVWDYAGLHETNFVAQIWNKYPKWRVVFDLSVASSVAFLTGHELGHHFADDVDTRSGSKAEQREREQKADDCALRLMRHTNTPAIYAFPLFIGFVLWDPEAHHYEYKMDHPDAKRRALNVLRQGADEMLADPKFLQYLRERGAEDEFRKDLDNAESTIQNLLNS